MTKVDRARVARLAAIETGSITDGVEESPAPRRNAGRAAENHAPRRAPPSQQNRRDARARFAHDNHAQLRASRMQATASASARKPKEVTIRGTDGRDNIEVSRLSDGRTRVENNGRVSTYARGTQITVDAGGGDDRVRISGAVNVGVFGGDGNDRINATRARNFVFASGGRGDDHLIGGRGDDTLLGDEGNDRVSGRGGDDELLGGDGRDVASGGNGNDNVYTGRGDDVISGGRGRDYLSGQDGSDVIRGGDGDDTLAGNNGSDILSGQAGNDVLIGGRSEDIVRGGDGNNIQYEGSIEIPKNIKVEGPAAFRRRVMDDLTTIAATPSGRRLLDDLAARGHQIRIKFDPEDHALIDTQRGVLRPDGTPGPGARGTTIGYSGTYYPLPDGVGQVAPPAGLYHELVHAYNNATGTDPGDRKTDGEFNAELGAVGLPIDHDGNPNTPRIQANPYYENLFRSELNIPDRPRY